MKGLEIYKNGDYFSNNNYTEDEIDKKINDFWDNIELYPLEFYDNHFNEIAEGLMQFLCFSLMHFKCFESGNYYCNGDFGSQVTFDQYNHRKRLNIKLNKKSEYLIELFIIDDFDDEERTYFKKINAILIPEKLRSILEETLESQDPKSYNINDL